MASKPRGGTRSATDGPRKRSSNRSKIPKATGRSKRRSVAKYLPQRPVENELVHRLGSLFWRVRRATSIETGLLRMQSEILQSFRSSRQKTIEPQTGEGEGAGIAGAFRP